MPIYQCFVVLIFLIVSYSKVLGQTEQSRSIDSLLSELPKHQNDTLRANILNKVAFSYSTVSPDKGIAYATQLLELSRQLEWQQGLAKANAVLGINYAARSEYGKAIGYYNEALEISKALGDSAMIASNNANLSLIYRSQGNYPKALAVAFEALGIYESLKDLRNAAITNENIGVIYYDQKEHDKAMQYYSAALVGYKAINDKGSIARCYGNIGAVLGATGELDKALQYHKMALETNRIIGNKYSVQIDLTNIGVIHFKMGDQGAALDNYFEALKISEEMGDRHSSAVNMGNIGEAYLAIANSTRRIGGAHVTDNKREGLGRAIKYLERSVSLCKELNYAGPYIEFSRILSEAYTTAGEHKKAMEAFKDHVHLKDSLFNIQSKLAITELELKRKEELQSKDLLISKKQNAINRLEAIQERGKLLVMLACGLAIIMLILFILKSLMAYRRSNRLLNREKEQHLEHIKTQKELLEEIVHMQAHEVSGPVATILGLVKVFNYNDPSDPSNQTIIKGIAEVTEVLDEKVKEVIRKKNAMTKL